MQTNVSKVIVTGTGTIATRPVITMDSKKDIRKKQQKPFVLNGDYTLEIYLKNGDKHTIKAYNGYTYDGATIPFKIGKGDMKLLFPALFHDIMCENHSLINNDRKLSSEIFYELLIAFHNNKVKSRIMFSCVELWQKLMGKWK